MVKDSHHMINMESSPIDSGKILNRLEKTNFNTPFYIRTSSDCRGDMFSSPVEVHNNFTEEEEGNNEPDHFFKSLKGFLIIGKVIGLLPYSGVFGSSSNNLTFRRMSLTSIITHLIFLSLVFNTALGLVASLRKSKRNALEIAESIREALYFVWGNYIFYTFIRRGKDFLKIFSAWNKTEVEYSTKDETLRRDTLLISGVILTSAILENAVLHMEYIKPLDSINGRKYGNKQDNMTFLEAYYWRAHPQWAKSLGYNSVLAVFKFIQHKWILYAWNYMDIAIAVFGRAMYFRFKILVKVAEEKLLGPKEKRMDGDKSEISKDPCAWLRLVRDHQNLCKLLGILENFFSPLIFASYAVNMFYICLQLLDGLTLEVNKRSIVHSIYAPWSFVHLIMRAYIVSICCARINVYAHNLMYILEECPIECYTKDVSRVDKRITAGPEIGLTGLQCFVVRKPFMLSLLATIFTLEIVLLQCVPHS